MPTGTTDACVPMTDRKPVQWQHTALHSTVRMLLLVSAFWVQSTGAESATRRGLQVVRSELDDPQQRATLSQLYEATQGASWRLPVNGGRWQTLPNSSYCRQAALPAHQYHAQSVNQAPGLKSVVCACPAVGGV